MNKGILAIIGIAIIGGVAYFLLKPSNGYEGGGFAGGDGTSKKEDSEPLYSPIYNITVPAPDFPGISIDILPVPWWMSGENPPSGNGGSKKQDKQEKALETLKTAPKTEYALEHPISTDITMTLTKKGLMQPSFATELLGYK